MAGSIYYLQSDFHERKPAIITATTEGHWGIVTPPIMISTPKMMRSRCTIAIIPRMTPIMTEYVRDDVFCVSIFSLYTRNL